MTTYSAEYIKNKLSKELEPEHFEIEDISDGCGAKFNCLIVSKSFDGLMLIKRHRMVNSILEEELKIIHAFSMKTYTPSEWAKKQTNSN